MKLLKYILFKIQYWWFVYTTWKALRDFRKGKGKVYTIDELEKLLLPEDKL